MDLDPLSPRVLDPHEDIVVGGGLCQCIVVQEPSVALITNLRLPTPEGR